MRRALILAALFPVLADAGCILQTNTVRSAAAIIEREQIKANIITSTANQRKCVVEFKARIGTEWHQAYGEASWDGASPIEESCLRASKVAEEDLITRVGSHELRSESMMICSDAPSANTLNEAKIGTFGANSQFRGHPTNIGYFWHNGTRCRWFIDSKFESSKVRLYSGIICEVSEGWVVVDIF